MKKQAHRPLANGLDKVRNEMRAARYSVIHKFKGVQSPLDNIL